MALLSGPLGSVTPVTGDFAETPGATGGLLSHGERVRLEAFRYAVNDEAAAYFAIMRTFSGAMSGLLSDQSASEVQQSLTGQGLDLDLDVVDERLSYLVERGNLARSPRESEARSIREYLQTRARYQLTQRGELVHRLVEELLGASDSAREVSSEMLGAIAEGLRSLVTICASDLSAIEPDRISREAITLFAQFERLVESTREFYTYLSEVLRRFDLDRAEFQVFKTALIGYLQRFVDEIALHMPQVGEQLAVLEPQLDALLERAGQGQRLVGLDGRQAQRDRGLEAADWRSMHTWFLGDAGRDSDAAQVRALATDAMSALLVNLRRIATSDDREASRYRDLLRLATWFETADDETAHAMWAAAFGLYPCRHLGFAADNDSTPVPATSSWWSTPVAEVPMTLRQFASRAMRGSLGRPADFTNAKARRVAERAREEQERRDALDELASHRGELTDVRMSDRARAALLEMYARALNTSGVQQSARAPGDSTLHLVVQRTVGRGTCITSPQGTLQLCDLTLRIESHAAESAQENSA